MLHDDGESQKSRLRETQVSQFVRARSKFNGDAGEGANVGR